MSEPKTLILVPGLLCDDVAWLAQKRLFDATHRVVVADHGSIDSLGGMAAAILDRAPARFALAGHSMGGRIALEVYRRAPERVEAIALMDTGAAPIADGEAGEKERAGRWRLADIARKEGMRAMAAEWLKIMIHPARAGDRALVGSIVDMFARKSPDIYEAQIRALIARPDARPLLGTIRCPALVLCGREDQWAGPPQHVELAAQIAGSRLEIVPDSGHMVTMEQPEAVNEAMRQWIGS